MRRALSELFEPSHYGTKSYVAVWVGAFALAGLGAIAWSATPGASFPLFGALLLLLVGILHSLLGELFIVRILLREAPEAALLGSRWSMRRTLRLGWHTWTVAFWGLGAALLASATGLSLRLVLSLTLGGAAALSLALCRGRHLSWIAFGAAAAVAWLGGDGA